MLNKFTEQQKSQNYFFKYFGFLFFFKWILYELLFRTKLLVKDKGMMLLSLKMLQLVKLQWGLIQVPSQIQSNTPHVKLLLVNTPKGVHCFDLWQTERKYKHCAFCFPPLWNRYEVAPRSDSEESGSEFEEEVSDFLINKLPQWLILNQPPCLHFFKSCKCY